MKSFCVLILILYNSLMSGQTVCKGTLLDGETGQAIEFANIGIIGKGLGTVTNEKGEYHFMIPDSLFNEQVKVSIIGYKPRIFPAREFQKRSEVRLEQAVVALKEVSVSVKKTKVKIGGNNTKTKVVSAGFKNNSLGAEIGAKLSVNHPQTHIRKVMININANTLDTMPMFRLNIYRADPKGYPGENLLTQNIIITPKEKTGYVEFDLLPYSIFVDEDVIISLEWIKDLGNAKNLTFSTKLMGSSTYYRQASQDKWEKIGGIGVGLHAELAY